MVGTTCRKCGGYKTPPQVWHAVIPPPMCSCPQTMCCPHERRIAITFTSGT